MATRKWRVSASAAHGNASQQGQREETIIHWQQAAPSRGAQQWMMPAKSRNAGGQRLTQSGHRGVDRRFIVITTARLTGPGTLYITLSLGMRGGEARWQA